MKGRERRGGKRRGLPESRGEALDRLDVPGVPAPSTRDQLTEGTIQREKREEEVEKDEEDNAVESRGRKEEKRKRETVSENGEETGRRKCG